MLKYASPLKELPDNWLQCVGYNGTHCNKKYSKSDIRYECDCPTKELLEVVIDFEPHMDVSPEDWRKVLTKRVQNAYKPGGKNIGIFKEFLPINDEQTIISLSEGITSIDSVYKVAKLVGLNELEVKSLGLNPTGSFKDYGMSMLMTHANWLHKNGFLKDKKVACASTGNTSSSLAAYAANAGFDCYIFVGGKGKPPSESKLFQTAFYGPKIVEIDGDFDDAMKFTDELSTEGYFYLGNSKNPYRIEGQKAIIMETLVQKDFDTDFVVALPVGNAGNAAAMTKALKEWKELGIIDELPRVYGIQADGANPLARKFETGVYKEITPETDASAISIGNPVSGEKAEYGIRETGGKIISVSDDDIFMWQRLLAKNSGIACEPASATSIAGTYQLVNDGIIGADEKVLCILTGNLLKDTHTPAEEKYNPGLLKRPKVAADKNAILNALKILA